jgi:hypothetical protein
MKRLLVSLPLLVVGLANSVPAQVTAWPPHARERPRPAIVTPGAFIAMPPPSDALVLFDGTGLGGWADANGGMARWRVIDGAFEVVPRTGPIVSRDSFGDVQLHIEWMSPAPPRGRDQDRGNSGIFFMGRYELQVLDSHDNETYADGQAAAVYGQYPPMVNASRPPGVWQSYDVVFRRPRFDAAGRVLSPARMTVLHNGILVQDNVELVGPTGHTTRPPYEAHADRLPLSLQDHGHPVRFRNVWVRDLE